MCCVCYFMLLINVSISEAVLVLVDLRPLCCCIRAEGSSKIQARIEQQSVRASQPASQFRAPAKPSGGVKTSPSKDNPSPEPQLDDIKRGETPV